MVLLLAKKGKWFSGGGLALLIGGLNQMSLQDPVVGGVCLIVFFVCTGALFGSRLVRDEDLVVQIGVGLSAAVALLAIGGSAIYYAGPVYPWMLFLLCIATLIIGALASTHLVNRCNKQQISVRSSTLASTHLVNRNWTAITAIAICIAAWWNAIAPIDITQSVRSLWLVVDPSAIISLGLAVLLSIAIAPLLSTRLRMSLLGIILLSVFVVPALTYSLGYGFDPFIHRTTIAHIAEFGTITPKPLYYIGQYALELIAATVFGLPIYLIDTLLVPVLAAFLLSACAVFGFGQVTHGRGWGSLALLLLPLGAFISTTPQALSYVFTGALIFLSLPILARSDKQPPRVLLGLLALAALITHPLAGIPACLYALLTVILSEPEGRVEGSLRRIKRVAFIIIALASAVVIPAVFLVQASLSGLAISFSLSDLAWDQLALTGFWHNQFSSVFDGLYLFIDNQLWISLLLAIVGAWLLIKRRAGARIHLPLLMVALWMINYLILTLTLQFDFLIEYERTNYAQRLITISLLFLVPHMGYAIDGVFDILSQRARALRLGWTILLAMMVSAGVYGAFPRHDNYARSAGFNVSTTDFDAAAAINDLGDDQEYIVLANQAVSAAALELYGFKRYYHDDIFYYPIPTGGELYSHYLEMADEEPTRAAMEEAMDLAGVDLGFFVLNDYWWDADRIREAGKQQADSWFGIGDGENEITVFIFTRTSDEGL